jgi:hypothetical protein
LSFQAVDQLRELVVDLGQVLKVQLHGTVQLGLLLFAGLLVVY